jgi:glycolate oxidase FAD binding subunit
MNAPIRPASDDDLRDVVAWAVAKGQPLAISAGSSKRALGRPSDDLADVELARLSGIIAYEPEELVLTARAGTPLTEIEAALGERGQMLAFEPPDLAALLGSGASRATIGGVMACNLAGPRRLKDGGARDHVLGFHAVSGRGEEFKSGGRVVKNVTGFDLSKLVTGSFGTLAVLTRITLRALPGPEKTATLLIAGCSDARATQAMTAALQTPYTVSGAAHLPAAVAGRSAVRAVAGAGAAVTALRVEGPAPSVTYRLQQLSDCLAGFGEIASLGDESLALWTEIGGAAWFATPADRQIWRLSVPPSTAAATVARITDRIGGEACYDWGGGLVWLALDPSPDAHHDIVRGAIAVSGGHATLYRAAADIRRQVPVFHPQPAPLAALTRRIKESFDPGGVLNPGRMYAGI